MEKREGAKGNGALRVGQGSQHCVHRDKHGRRIDPKLEKLKRMKEEERG